MKKRVFCMALALVLTLGLAIPAFAATEEPEYRLASVITSNGSYTFSYGQGGYLPTEILFNGELSATVAYDEEGHVISRQEASNSYTYTYDEEGHMLSKSYTSPGSYITSSADEYTYDSDGNQLTEYSSSVYGDGTTDSDLYEYSYDENGILTGYTTLSVDTEGNETTSTSEYEYTFDSDGNIITEIRFRDGEEVDSMSYTYDDEGRKLEETGDKEFTHNYYLPLLFGAWMKNTVQDALSGTTRDLSSFALNFPGNQIYSFVINCSAEPQLTYDDNGYLIKVDDGAGNYIELTYEPVA